MSKLCLKDLLPDTSTNVSGYVLYNSLKKYVVGNESVVLDFKGTSSLSSSFFNSSLGSLIEDFGFDSFKRSVKIINITKSQAALLSKYLSNFKKYSH